MSTPTLAQLQRAIHITKQIEALEAEIAAIFKGSAAPKAAPKAQGAGKGKKATAPKAKAPAKRRKISAAHRAKLAAAAKARWARIRAGKEPSPIK